MQKIGNQTIISMVYQNAVGMNLFDDVIVVTDSESIVEEIQKMNGRVVKSKREHQSGSDRIAEACENMDVDIIVNNTVFAIFKPVSHWWSLSLKLSS